MIKISHHGATSGVTGSCHELRLNSWMKKGSDPVGSDPNFIDPVGSAPFFTWIMLSNLKCRF